MPLTLSTNVPSLANLDFITRMVGKHTQRISSGLRINSAADDAAGYAVAMNLSSRDRSVGQALRNTSQGISYLQTAESANSEVGNLVSRMREIAVQGASSTLSTSQRTDLQTELDEVIAEVGRIAAGTEFNKTKLTDGTTTTLTVQVGPNNSTNDQIRLSFGDLGTSTLSVAGLSVASSASASAAITTVDTAMDSINSYASKYGAQQNRLDSNVSNLEVYQSTLQSSYSSIMDADYAYETAQYTRYQVQQQAAISVLAQANVNRQLVLQLLK
jgi:flagellin